MGAGQLTYSWTGGIVRGVDGVRLPGQLTWTS
jgi:hypothetical protein